MWGILAIGLGGALGSLSRYGVNIAVYRLFGGVFPMGTLLVNVLGCFLIGFFIEYDALVGSFPREVKLMVVAGFLGAFTTFSTFGLELVFFVEQRAYTLLAANIVSNVGLGLLAVFGGMYLGRFVWGA